MGKQCDTVQFFYTIVQKSGIMVNRYSILTNGPSFHLLRSIVYLEIDNRLCSQDSDNCFPSADSAAEYLGALSAREMLRFPYPLKAVRSEYIHIPFFSYMFYY